MPVDLFSKELHFCMLYQEHLQLTMILYDTSFVLTKKNKTITSAMWLNIFSDFFSLKYQCLFIQASVQPDNSTIEIQQQQ
jgi:hypothetical protein